jgi:hypothetical protein
MGAPKPQGKSVMSKIILITGASSGFGHPPIDRQFAFCWWGSVHGGQGRTRHLCRDHLELL